MKKYTGKLLLMVFVFTAFVLGMGVWNNYRPQVIYASCSDIAEKTSNLIIKKEILDINEEITFDVALNDCLSESGYYER